MIKRLTTLAVLVFSTQVIRAQETEVQADTTSFSIGFNGTGSLNKTGGNTAYVFNNGLRFGMIRNRFDLSTGGTWIYGENGIEKTNNDFSFFADLSYLKGYKRVYYWGLTTYDKSFSLKIADRLQAGGGVGFTVADRDHFRLVITDGPLYEKTALREQDKYGRLHYETLRNSFRIKFLFEWADRFVLDGTDYIQNSLSDGNDYIIRSVTNLSIKLYKSLNLKTTLTYNRLNLTGTENLLFTYGISFDKEF